MLDLPSINHGFSGKAPLYDAYGESHPVIRWARGRVRAEVMRCIAPGASILELNAGTGADAAYFAAQGYRVHATDVADGMLAQIAAKIAASGCAERFTTQQLSFTELERVNGGPYDLVFSNFGGLNCVPDVRPVAEVLPRVLKPGGWVVWVVMPPVCLWEWAQLLRGQWRTATRRLRLGGVRAHVEGAHFQTYYFTPTNIMRALSSSFQQVSLQSLCLFCPPSFMDNFPHRFPRLTQQLMALDERLGARWPFNQWGDFYILTMRFQSQSLATNDTN
jgi:ubiquinone/menaquinone biosynthesis C-methylase UbiE